MAHERGVRYYAILDDEEGKPARNVFVVDDTDIPVAMVIFNHSTRRWMQHHDLIRYLFGEYESECAEVSREAAERIAQTMGTRLPVGAEVQALAWEAEPGSGMNQHADALLTQAPAAAQVAARRFLYANELDGQHPEVRAISADGHIYIVGDGGTCTVTPDGRLDYGSYIEDGRVVRPPQEPPGLGGE